LRYTGFEHSGSTRVFRFEQIVPSEDRRIFLVTVELSLFAKHHIALQEGPGLCLRLLTTDSGVGDRDDPKSRRALSDRDMLEHNARRPAARKSFQGGRTVQQSGSPDGET